MICECEHCNPRPVVVHGGHTVEEAERLDIVALATGKDRDSVSLSDVENAVKMEDSK